MQTRRRYWVATLHLRRPSQEEYLPVITIASLVLLRIPRNPLEKIKNTIRLRGYSIGLEPGDETIGG